MRTRLLPKWRLLLAVPLALLPFSQPALGSDALLFSVQSLRSSGFPASILLPEGTRLLKTTLTRRTASLADDAVVIYNTGNQHITRYPDFSVTDVVTWRGTVLERVVFYDPDNEQYQLPYANQYDAGAFDKVGAFLLISEQAYRAQPLPLSQVDSDSDGLSDLAETNTQRFVSDTDTGTSPITSDSDGDGLSDGEEVTVYLTNPTLADSDGDGIDDGAEIAAGSDPLSDDKKVVPLMPWSLQLVFAAVLLIAGMSARYRHYLPKSMFARLR